MGHIVLSQRIDKPSSYKDVLYEMYHFPKTYRNQVKSGDLFVYYQGRQGPATRHRYYHGFGVVGAVYPDPTQPDHFYAELIDAQPLPNKVSIYHPDGGYYESLGYKAVRGQPIPSWQRSVRRLSPAAYEAILAAAGASEVQADVTATAWVEAAEGWIHVLNQLNQKYHQTAPAKRQVVVDRYLDRGTAVTRVLKQILGAKCQVCGVEGFLKRNGDRYIEAHHLIQVSRQLPYSLCSDNVILVCPICHRKLHHAAYDCEASEQSITIRLDGRTVTIKRNTAAYLAEQAGNGSGKALEVI